MIWGVRVEPWALATEVEIRRSAVELERLRTQVELMGERSIFEELALEGTFEERTLEDRKPPPCPSVQDVSSAHPQPRCRGRSSTLRSHCPRLAPSWWALSPALAPSLTGWAQLPGRSFAQSLGFALARRTQQK